MTRTNFLVRQPTGIYHIQIRLPRLFSAKTTLARFSTGTRDHRRARKYLLRSLAWMIPMKDARSVDQIVGLILAQIHTFLSHGRAADENDLRHRLAFCKQLERYLAEWAAANPCPIEYAGLHRKWPQLKEGYLALATLNDRDLYRFNLSQTGTNPLASYKPKIVQAFEGAPPRIPEQELLELAETGHYDLAPDELWFDPAGYSNDEFALNLSIDKSDEELISGFISKFSGSAQAALEPQQEPETEGAPVPPPAAFIPRPQKQTAPSRLLSEARLEYLDYRAKAQGDRRDDEDAGLILQFLIDFLGDKPLCELNGGHFQALENAMAATPNRKGIPRKVTSLMGRYLYAQEHGWDNLETMSVTRIKVWHQSLQAFFIWAKDKTFYDGPQYKFNLVPADAADPQDRDVWTDDELIKLFSLPLFTGCESSQHFWSEGTAFVQNEIYWAYILIVFTGMRHSEIGSLRGADITAIDGIDYFDLRIDRTVKTLPKKPKKKRKTKNSERLIPIPAIVKKLGLLERAEDLKSSGIESLFPEWTPYVNAKSGRKMPGHHFSKSWQYIKKKFAFERPGLTSYGGRHTKASWLDAKGVPPRLRNLYFGHSHQTVAQNYGAIKITTDEAKYLLEQKAAIEDVIAEILLQAKIRAVSGQLEVVKTWI